jgi:hypothetical protein
VISKRLQERDLPLEHSRIRDEVCYRFSEEDQDMCHGFLKLYGKDVSRLLRRQRLNANEICQSLDLNDLGQESDQRGVLGAVGSKVGDMARSFYDRSRNAEEWVKEKGERAWEDLTGGRREGDEGDKMARQPSGGRRFKERAEDKWEEGKGEVRRMGEKARQKASEEGDRLRQRAGDMKEQTKEKVGRAGEAVRETGERMMGRGEEDNLRYQGRRVARDAGQTRRELKEERGREKAHELKYEGEEIANRMRNRPKRNMAYDSQPRDDEGIVDKLGNKINRIGADVSDWWYGRDENESS